MDLSPTFRKRLFDAKTRLLGLNTSLLFIPREEDVEDDELWQRGGQIATVLNRLCFPEFKLHLEGDSEDVKT